MSKPASTASIPDRKLSLYSNAYSPKPISAITLSTLLKAIHSGRMGGLDIAKLIREVRLADDKKGRDKVKRKLPAVTFGGIFTARSYKGLSHYTGLMVVDVDKVGKDEATRIRNQAGALPYVAAAWISPSGDGCKVLVHHEGSSDDQRHVYATAAAKLDADCKIGSKKDYGIDPNSYDVARLCYLGHDAAIKTAKDPDLVQPITVDEAVVAKVPKGSKVTEDSDEQRLNEAAARLPDVTEDVARDCLRHIDPFSDRPGWLRLLAAIKAQFGDDGERIARDWSVGDLDPDRWAPDKRSNYDEDGFDAAWASLSKARGKGMRDITFRSVLRMATEQGWPGMRMIKRKPAKAADDLMELVSDDADTHKKTGLVPTQRTMDAIWQHDPELRGLLRRNTRNQSVEYSRPAPWGSASDRNLTDVDIYAVNSWLMQKYGSPAFSKDLIRDKMERIATELPFDPVIDYLHSLPDWDGVPRINTFFQTYFGSLDKAWHAGAARVWFAAAVARALKPGVKFDHMIIFTGGQGVGKSSGVEALFSARDDFYSNSDIDFRKDAKDWLPILCRCWCHESAEMGSLTKADADRIKHVITANKMDAILKYDKYTTAFKYGFVMTATTNEKKILRDSTGNRRFIVIESKPTARVAVAKIAQDRDQIWAEAVALYKGGQRWWFDKDKDSKLADAIQRDTKLHDAATDDPLYEPIKRYTDGDVELKVDPLETLGARVVPGRGIPRDAVASRDICVVLDTNELRADQRLLWRIKGILSALGFAHDRVKIPRGGSAFANRCWGWVREQ